MHDVIFFLLQLTFAIFISWLVSLRPSGNTLVERTMARLGAVLWVSLACGVAGFVPWSRHRGHLAPQAAARRGITRQQLLPTDQQQHRASRSAFGGPTRWAKFEIGGDADDDDDDDNDDDELDDGDVEEFAERLQELFSSDSRLGGPDVGVRIQVGSGGSNDDDEEGVIDLADLGDGALPDMIKRKLAEVGDSRSVISIHSRSAPSRSLPSSDLPCCQ